MPPPQALSLIGLSLRLAPPGVKGDGEGRAQGGKVKHEKTAKSLGDRDATGTLGC